LRQSCIHYAIRYGDILVVDYILNHIEDINKIDKHGNNLFSYSLLHGKVEISNLLKSRGAVQNLNFKKFKVKKNPENNIELNSSNLYKCTLVKILDDGKKIPLSLSEYENFKNEYPIIYEILQKNNK
jgi:ankyrin repeat protein